MKRKSRSAIFQFGWSPACPHANNVPNPFLGVLGLDSRGFLIIERDATFVREDEVWVPYQPGCVASSLRNWSRGGAPRLDARAFRLPPAETEQPENGQGDGEGCGRPETKRT